MRYLIVVEHDETSYGAYCPDVPGCFAVGKTPQETIQRMQGALAAHLQWLRDEGDPVPLPVTQVAPSDADSVGVDWVDVSVA